MRPPALLITQTPYTVMMRNTDTTFGNQVTRSTAFLATIICYQGQERKKVSNAVCVRGSNNVRNARDQTFLGIRLVSLLLPCEKDMINRKLLFDHHWNGKEGMEGYRLMLITHGQRCCAICSRSICAPVLVEASINLTVVLSVSRTGWAGKRLLKRSRFLRF